MSKRLVTILWAIVGLLAALTLIVKSSQSRDNDAPTKFAQGDVPLKKLPLNEVATIKVEDADKTVTIKKGESQWSIAERGDYEADFPKLTRLLRSLTEVSIAQSKKAGPAFNERFGMDSEAENQDSHGYHLTFLNAEGKEIQSLAIGKSTGGEGASAAGKYVRFSNEPEAVYAVNESFFDLSADPTDWLSNDFISVNGIQSITLTPNEDDTVTGWTVNRENAGSDFTIEGLAANREPQADKLTPLKNVLSAPRFEDVLTEEEAKAQRDESKARQITLKTFEGFTYTIDYAPPKPAESDPADGIAITSGFILKVDVAADLPAERVKKEGESEEDAKKAEAEFAANQKELQKKLAKEQAFSKHYYTVADYTLTALNIGLDSLAKAVVKTDAIAPTNPQQQFGPLAPPEPVRESSTTARPARPSAVSPPIAVPSAPKAAEEEDAEEKSGSNADALNVLSEEDIKRIVEESKKAKGE